MSAGSTSARATVFHVANAYDSADAIVLQVVRYPELWRDSGGFDAEGVLWTWTIDLRNGIVTERQLDDRAVEFPRIDDRLAGLPARYSVAVGGGRLVPTTSTAVTLWSIRSGSPDAPGGPGEAVFVPSPSGPPDETNGWYLARLRPGARQQRPGHPWTPPTSPGNPWRAFGYRGGAVRLSRQLDRRPIRQPMTRPRNDSGAGCNSGASCDTCAAGVSSRHPEGQDLRRRFSDEAIRVFSATALAAAGWRPSRSSRYRRPRRPERPTHSVLADCRVLTPATRSQLRSDRHARQTDQLTERGRRAGIQRRQ